MSTHDDFDWAGMGDDELIVPETPETAVYANPRGGVVIRQREWPDDDHFVHFDKCYAVNIARAILRQAGRDDLEIVKVSEITVVGREGNVMTVPASDLEKIDAISREMRADKQRRKPDPTAKERQRRRREKQHRRDVVTDLVPEFDLQNGGPKALAN